MVKFIDLAPSPRVLAMLGEIDLEPWRCIAELIDNGIDSFLLAELDENKDNNNHRIDITIPKKQTYGKNITVKDNGPGLSLKQLENMVKAGWTSKSGLDTLGLFGMGFNIATARLGTVTQVWTTRKEDDEWVGVEIDFEKLIKEKSFQTEKLTRPKIERNESGTEVNIAKLKNETSRWFTKSYNRRRLKNILSRAYSSILEGGNNQLGDIKMYLNNEYVKPYKFCVWGNPNDGPDYEPRYGKSNLFGKINAYQEIKEVITERPFCLGCKTWLREGEVTCEDCEESNREGKIIPRECAIYGWLGIQRYGHKTDYGIDFIRNGRAIEMKNKDLFKYQCEDGSEEPEYQIDDAGTARGRIVGQIHLDHGDITYTKDHFIREDKAWREMKEVVRGKGCLLPKHEEHDKQNESPLQKLHNAFRRNTPQYGDVAKNYHRWPPLLFHPDNIEAENWAESYRKGNKEYVYDNKWYSAVMEKSDDLKSKLPDEPGRKDPFTKKTDEEEEGKKGAPEKSDPRKDLISLKELTGKYKEKNTGISWDIESFEIEKSNLADLGLTDKGLWNLQSEPSGKSYFYVRTDHDGWHFLSMTPGDALMTELAYQALELSKSKSQESFSFAKILCDLRKDYTINDYTDDPQELRSRTEDLLKDILDNLSSSDGMNTDDFQSLFDSLNPEEIGSLSRKLARSNISISNSVSNGKFLRYIDIHMLITLFERETERFFDGICWNEEYDSLPGEGEEITITQKSFLRLKYLGMLNDLASYLEGIDITNEKDFITRVNTSINLLKENLVSE